MKVDAIPKYLIMLRTLKQADDLEGLPVGVTYGVHCDECIVIKRLVFQEIHHPRVGRQSKNLVIHAAWSKIY
nr:hypothetical transcript [Hymenolepis microstoma]